MEYAQFIGIAIFGGIIAILAIIICVKGNIVLCQPSELVVLAGRQRTLDDGTKVGYRVLRGGRGFKWPMLESAARLSLNTIPIDLTLTRAMCSGMIPVSIEGRASVKLAGRAEHGMDAAVERFLGKGSDAVSKAAKQALEGALRGIIATMTPEDANANRLQLAQDAAETARRDLQQLGIVLDFLQIQEITDDEGYLQAIGRKQNAAVQRDARIAEATAEADARKVSAEQKRIGREAEISADLEVIEKENALEVKRANLQASENDARERASVAGEIARVEEEIKWQAQRASLCEKQQEADVVVPARAEKTAKLLAAEGEAARIQENGRATAEAIELMRSQWQDGATRDLFLIQLLPELTDKITSVISDNLRIDRLTILDGGDGEGLPNFLNNLTNSTVSVLEQVKNATGVDLADLARRSDKGAGPKIPKDLS
jgi:flotillin